MAEWCPEPDSYTYCPETHNYDYYLRIGGPVGQAGPSIDVMVDQLAKEPWLSQGNEEQSRQHRSLSVFFFDTGYIQVRSDATRSSPFARPWLNIKVVRRLDSSCLHRLDSFCRLAATLGMKVASARRQVLTERGVGDDDAMTCAACLDDWVDSRLAELDDGEESSGNRAQEPQIDVLPLAPHLDELWREMGVLLCDPRYAEALDLLDPRFARAFVNLMVIPRIWLRDGRERQVREAMEAIQRALEALESSTQTNAESGHAAEH